MRQSRHRHVARPFVVEYRLGDVTAEVVEGHLPGWLRIGPGKLP